uniref:L1 transposable element RRM domain-containing protein n=1 Tax=Photinus pyralis TaxID=7054 RepID=A0A1Y1M2P7_PHOPY
MSSDLGETVDANYKRKRNKASPDPSQRSKKTSRSPSREEQRKPTENEMEEIKDLINSMRCEIKEDMQNNKDELMEGIKINNELVAKLRAEFQQKEIEWQKERKVLSDRIAKLEHIVEHREKRDRKNNIIIKGLKTNAGRAKEETETFLSTKLDATPHIRQVRKIPTKDDFPILCVELENWEDKLEIMKKKKVLGQAKIYIENDLTKEEGRIQSEIRNRAREERQKGNRVRTSYQRMTINGKNWRWDLQLDRLVEEDAQTKNG